MTLFTSFFVDQYHAHQVEKCIYTVYSIHIFHVYNKYIYILLLLLLLLMLLLLLLFFLFLLPLLLCACVRFGIDMLPILWRGLGHHARGPQLGMP